MTIHPIQPDTTESLQQQIVAELRAGNLWGLAADSAYAICGDAFSPRAIRTLREIRNKGDFVTPILIGREINLEGIAEGISDEVRDLIKAFWPGPLTLLARPHQGLAWEASRDAISVRMPADEFTRAIAYELGPMVAVAASRGNRPAPTTAIQAAEMWGSDVPNWVDSGAQDSTKVSTVIDIRGAKPNIVRLGALTKNQIREVAPSVIMIATD